MIVKTTEKQIWFPAKKYGWGWGPPCAWQGWMVMVIFVVSLVIAGVLLLPGGHFGLWIASIVLLVTGLMIVCFLKGEKPRWRWGKN